MAKRAGTSFLWTLIDSFKLFLCFLWIWGPLGGFDAWSRDWRIALGCLRVACKRRLAGHFAFQGPFVITDTRRRVPINPSYSMTLSRLVI